MRFTGVECVFCKNAFTENDDVVVCPQCGSPHHRGCWLENGECANKNLHGEGFGWVFPEELKPEQEKTEPSRTDAEPTDFRFKNGEHAVTCPHCNALNYGNDALCMKCRKPLRKKIRNDYNSENPERYLDEENMYEYYERFGGLRPDIMIEGIPVLEYSDYIGEKKSGRYIRKFAAMERYGRKFSVSICALLFGPIWYLYRKMFKEGLIYLLTIILLTGIQVFCSITEPVKDFYEASGEMYAQLMNGEITLDEFNEWATEYEAMLQTIQLSGADKVKDITANVLSAVQLLLSFAMAFAADYLYKRKIQADIMKIRKECSDMPTYRKTLHEKGGTSAGGVVLGIIGSSLAYFLNLLPAYIIMFNSFSPIFEEMFR